MHKVGAFEAKTHFSSLLERVILGEKILITKHGQIVAKLVPVTGVDKEKIENAIQEILSFQNSHILGLDWKELRDEGRK